MMDFLLKHKNAILITSTLMVVVSIVLVLTVGFKFGIDFTSGSLWQLRIQNTNSSELRDFLVNDLGIGELNISVDKTENVYALSFKEVSEADRQELLTKLNDKFGGVEDLDFSTISPSISSELKDKAYVAMLLVLVGISIFVAFAFRKVSEPIKSWKYGLITLVTLLHDVAIPSGVFVVLGKLLGVAIDTNFIVALLFVMGFSVNDTIVVFDRIRENLLIAKSENQRKSLTEIVDSSVKETVARSINTSLTLVIMLLALFFLGPVSTKFFVLTILIGTIAGTYSSIFFASPLLLVADRASRHPHV